MLDTLFRQREEVLEALIWINDNADRALVRTSIESCGLQAKLWSVQESIYLLAGDSKEAEGAARRAVEFERQVALAAKAEIADRVMALEERNTEQRKRAGRLRGLRVVDG